MAVPSIVANVTTPLLGLIDTAIVGHMGDAAYIGAIAVGGVMFNMLYWLFSFLRAGTSGLSAQAYGASDRDESALVLYRSLLVALCAGVGMVLLQWPVLWLLRVFVDPDPVTGALASDYFAILIYGAPAVLGTFGVVSRYAEFAYAHGHIHCDKPVEHRCQPVAGVWPRMEDSRGGRRHAGCPMARLFHRFVAASSLQASTSAVAPGSEG